jgi:hypothetical protein
MPRVEIIAVRDGADTEAVGIVYAEAVLVFLQNPRGWKPPKVIHTERREERGAASPYEPRLADVPERAEA